MNNANNLSENRAMNRIFDNLENDESSSDDSYSCPAGGIHDFEKQWLVTDYLMACYCCPFYIIKDCCCGWCYRNPMDDSFDGIGCRPTGPGICSKCKQSEQQTKDAFALRQFRAHTGAGVHSPSPPRVPAPVQYVSTRQMSHPSQTRPPPQHQKNPSAILTQPPPPTMISPQIPYPTHSPPPYDELNDQDYNGLQYGQGHDSYNRYQNHAVNLNRENVFQGYDRDPNGVEQGNNMTPNHIKDSSNNG